MTFADRCQTNDFAHPHRIEHTDLLRCYALQSLSRTMNRKPLVAAPYARRTRITRLLEYASPRVPYL